MGAKAATEMTDAELASEVRLMKARFDAVRLNPDTPLDKKTAAENDMAPRLMELADEFNARKAAQQHGTYKQPWLEELEKQGGIGALMGGPLEGGFPRNSGQVARRSTGWGDAVVKAVGGADGKSLVPSGSITVPNLSSGIVRTADRPRSLLQLLGGERLEGTDQFSYLRETVRTQNAAPVAVGARKPTSVYSLEKVDDRAKTIAHLSEPIPRQWLADAALLHAYVEGSLREGVELALEDQVVDGDGTGENLCGWGNTTNRQTQAFATNIVVTARKAITKLEVVNIVPTAFVFSPGDWETTELYTDLEGDYVLGKPGDLPVDRANRRLWGVPVVTTTALASGRGFLVDASMDTMELRERESVRVDWSENTYDPDALGEGDGASDFERNMIRFRGEGRWGFAVKRPLGVVEIDTAA